MDRKKESEQLFSLRLSLVMDDIGVNRRMIDWRRKKYLWYETIANVCFFMINRNIISYVFGSQTEATTTHGMYSDFDILHCEEIVHVIYKLNKWQKGRPNVLVLRDELTPPQHCYLQRLRADCPLPADQAEGPDDVLIGDGRVLVANTRVQIHEQYGEDVEVIQCGPSLSFTKDIDIVHSCQSAELPEECQFMFNRPRPGHWPRKGIMEWAREAGVFLVPQGYSESPTSEVTCKPTAFVCMIPSTLPNYPYSKWQWRFSTSLMERYLMFDLNTVQVKAYIIAKMIRKSVFKPQYGDRFSTFHFKTAMMYTVENYPPTVWREDNIVQCISLILTTLTRWLKQKYCPHFTISGVNLFVGKLHKWELPKLFDVIFNLINTKLQCLNDINMDNIDMRLQQCTVHEIGQTLVIINMNTSFHLEIFGHALHREIGYLIGCVQRDFLYSSVEFLMNILRKKSNSLSKIEQEAVSLITPFIQSILASKLASRCMSLGEPITQHILNLFELSFESDLMSSRLKFASMLFCGGQYEEATDVLTYCERLLGSDVWQCCIDDDRLQRFLPTHELWSKLIFHSSIKKLLSKYIMVCIAFTKEEVNCIPKHLAYELCRCIEAKGRLPNDKWKNNVVIDCIPFLFYLQYLTYRELYQPVKALTALDNLLEYTNGTLHGHIDTAHNMLGHCFELQNRLDQAWLCYRNSLKIYNEDNAAIWHVARIVHKFITKTTQPFVI